MRYILAIDQGTTSTRAILFDENQNVVKVAQKALTNIFPHPGHVEQDAQEIWLSALSVIQEIFYDGKIKAQEVASIGIANQRETTVIWDKESGQPVYNAIVWQSRQSSYIVDRIKKAGYDNLFKEKTGLLLDPYFSFTKIMWLYENIPGLKNNENLLFGTVDTWLLWKLTGGKVHATDVTNASRTGLMNIAKLDWDDELLKLFDIPRSILPEIKDTAADFGKVLEYYFFAYACPIMSLIGDQQAALFGQSCFKRGESKNTYGTGGFLLINTGASLIKSKHDLLSTVAWKIGNEITYALEGSIFVSGSLIQWLRDSLKIIGKAQDSEAIASSIDDNGGVYIVPAFTGMGAPYWDKKARGLICGLTRGSDYRYLVRAALEAMAYQVKDLLDAVEEDIGYKIDSLRVDGGAASNNFLLQFQSDLLQMPIMRKPMQESTALGAARMAGLKAGVYHYEDFTNDTFTVFEPQKDAEMMNLYYQGWLNAVAKCLKD